MLVKLVNDRLLTDILLEDAAVFVAGDALGAVRLGQAADLVDRVMVPRDIKRSRPAERRLVRAPGG